MSEEKRKVLEMLEAGKITREDAFRLLEALGETETGEIAVPAPGAEESFRQAVEEAQEETQDVPTAIEAEAPASTDEAAAEETADRAPGEEIFYSCPNGEERITSLKIEWINGPVEVRPWNGDRVNVTEYSKFPLSEEERLELTVSDGTMRIRWTKDRSFWGMWKGKIFRAKHLVVELPEKIACRLEELEVKNVSGSVSAADLRGENLDISTTSGPIFLRNAAGEEIKCRSVSGTLKLENISGEDLVFNTTSGGVSAQDIRGEDVKITSISGTVKAFGSSEDWNVSTTSGSIELRTFTCPEDAGLKSVSGKITLVLPEKSGFTAKYNTVSGSFHTDFPVSGSLGQKSGKIVSGAGEADLTLSTMSGSIEVKQG